MIKALLTDKITYVTLSLILVITVVAGVLLNFWIMPAYTQYREGLTVPQLTKKSLAEARSLLTSYGLRYEVADRRANNAYPADYIIDQKPKAGEIVKPNRKIYLTVNTATTPTVVVPDVKNLSLRNAQIQLQNYGLKVGVLSYASSRFKNSIMRQSIPAGDTVPKGSVVNLTVSDGLGVKRVPIPEIVGLRLPEAQKKLQEIGLRVDKITFEPNKEFVPNTILEYKPSAKDTLVIGSTLDLVVSERFRVEEESESGAVNIDSTDVVLPDSVQSDSQNR